MLFLYPLTFIQLETGFRPFYFVALCGFFAGPENDPSYLEFFYLSFFIWFFD
jgi:hypothetical protein